MRNTNQLNQEEYYPSPINRRVCKCGCGHDFQPGRKDQFYINKRHYDADYNRNNRKIKNQHIIAVEKQLSLNNRTLDKYYKANITNQKKGFVQCYLTILKADNFTTQHHAGIVEKGAKTFYCLYDYKYCLFKNTINQLIIEIHKE